MGLMHLRRELMYFYFQLTILVIFLILALAALIRHSRKSSANSEASILIILENRLATLNRAHDYAMSKTAHIVCD